MWTRVLKVAAITAAVVATLWASWLTGNRIMGEPLPGRILTAAGHVIWGGGACTLAGCGSNFTVDVGEDFIDGVVYDIVLCLDHQCWESETVFEDRVSGSGDPLQVEFKGTITVHLENTPRPLTSAVTLVVRADGEKVVDHKDQVVFQVHQPNGPFCEPTCYNAILNL